MCDVVLVCNRPATRNIRWTDINNPEMTEVVPACVRCAERWTRAGTWCVPEPATWEEWFDALTFNVLLNLGFFEEWEVESHG